MPGLKLAPKSDQSDYAIQTPTIGDYDVAFGIQNPGLGRRVRPGTDNLVSLMTGASNGDTFILEPGTHFISAPIVIGGSLFNISIIGMRGAIIKGTGGPSIAKYIEIGTIANGLRLEGFTFEVRTGDGNAIEVTGATDEVVIKDIMFIKEGTALAGSCIEFALGAGVDAVKWTIEGCFASQGDAVNNWVNFITTDTTTSKMSHFKILNNTITSTGILASSSGIRFLTSGGLDNSIIHGNTIKNVDVTGIQIQAGSDNRVTVNSVLLGIDRGFNIKSNTTIIGFNDVNGASDIGIAIEGNNCICDGNRTNDCVTAIVLREGAIRCIISNNSIIGGSGHDGIELRSAGGGVGDDHRIIGNVISGTDRGIELQDGEDVVISDNQILSLFVGVSPLGVGIWLSGTEVRRCQIRDNYIEPDKEGILDESDKGFHTFQDNEIRGGTIGIFVDAGFDGDGIVIKGNKFITQSNSAIRIFFDADGPIVTENIIRGSTGATQMILCKRNSTGDSKLQINDNHIVSCASATRCIQIDGANNAQVNDNRIANNGGDGIGLITSENCSVSHNHITDQTGDGIQVTADSPNNEIVGNIFKAITGTNLIILGTGCRTERSFNPLAFMAGDFDPVSASDFPVNTLAAAQADENDNSMTVRAHPDSAESGFSFRLNIPIDTQRLKITGQIRQNDAVPAAGDVRLSWYERRIESNPSAFPAAGSPNADLAVITLPANELWLNFERELSLSALGMADDQRHQIEFTRRPASGGDTLGKDVRLERLELTFI